MSDATDLVEFQHARLDEDESAALGAKGDTPGRWEEKSDPTTWIVLYDRSGKLTMGQERHIARHDPARALREVEAKRATIADYERAITSRDRNAPTSDSYRFWDARVLALFHVLRRDAAVHSEHPDYREEWKP